MKRLALSLLTILFQIPLESSWIDRKAEGWAWYENRAEKEIEVEPSKKAKSAHEMLSAAKQQLEEKLAEALINPTEASLRDYMVEQKRWVQQSADFAHLWEKVLLQSPELDPTATSYPVTQYGIQLQKEIENENKRLFISSLSKENGLFFFYEGQSKISQGLAKVIKTFSEKYSWEVVAISIDGTILEELGAPRMDNGISQKMAVSIFPALFVVDPNSKTATPVAYGFVSLEQIENKIMLQFKTPIKADHE